MGKLRKYQLLEKAMRDYPAGTAFTSLYHGVECISTGVHFVSDGDGKDDKAIMCSIDGVGRAVFCFGRNEWAIKVEPSILQGKCAIQVNNEREFKLLMEHYEGKGWKLDGDYIQFGFPKTAYYDSTNNGMSCGNQSSTATERLGYTVIPFDQFAKEVGVEAPVFVMTSEDGVPMYRGDDYYRTCFIEGEWRLTSGVGRFTANDPIRMPAFRSAWFSTRETAEKWIAEQNKPQHVEVKLFGRKTANIHQDGSIRVFDDNRIMNLVPSDLEDMLHAYKTLHQ